MPVQMLWQTWPQENTGQLIVQLKKELEECKNADPTGRNHVMEFMLQNGIRHISELDYPFREQFQKQLQERGYAEETARKYLTAYDKVKQHSAQQGLQQLVGGKMAVPAYKNEILFLPYHPNLQIAKRFEHARNKKDLVWDFARKVPEKLKRQVYEILHYSINMEASKSEMRTSLMGLRELYDFCTQERITDIERMEQVQADQFVEKEDMHLSRKIRLNALNFCRKVLFIQGSEIHWHAHVWYMERIHLQPERVDRAFPVGRLSFLEVTHQRNRELLKQYARYGLGLTNLSVSSLRSELNCIRSFLAGLGQGEADDVCMVTQEDMDAYFKKEKGRPIQAETYNIKIMRLIHFFRFLQARNYIEKIPFDGERYLLKVQPYHHDRDVPQETVEEILTRLHELPEIPRLMFLHLWGIGLRISEVCTLKGNAYYQQGKDAWIQVYQIKMRNYKRIPIPAALYKLMKVYLKKHGIAAEAYVFQNTKGGAYKSKTFRWQMQEYCKKTQIQNGTYSFQCHDYRHSVATYFYDMGVPLQSIRDYLGHDYEEMTQQYVDYMPKRIDKASEEYFSQHTLASNIRRKEADLDGE